MSYSSYLSRFAPALFIFGSVFLPPLLVGGQAAQFQRSPDYRG